MAKSDNPDDAARAAARALGARGGKKGGPARWRGVTKAERSAQMKAIRARALVKKLKAKIARKAARARWRKER